MAETRLVRRFSRTERAGHWVNASAFFGLLGSGLVLYLPALSDAVGRRPLVKAIHLYIAIGWALALLVVVLAGDRRALGETRRELERLDLDDVRWLTGWPAPQGRFNAGQKIHAIAQAAFAVLFAFSGALLWLGERNTTLRFAGTIVLHDGLTLLATTLVAGHLYFALIAPRTRPALRSMIRGTVRESWAREQHPKWLEDASSPGTRTTVAGGWPRPGVRRFLVVAVLLTMSIGAYAALRPSGSAPASARAAPFAPGASLPPAIARGTALADHALALDQAGHLAAALPLFAQATGVLPGIADIRTLYGWALARSGRSREALRELQQAVRLDSSLPAARLYLGVVLARRGLRARARTQLQRAVALDPAGPTAARARQLLAAG
ncbi:MAG: cytochrome b/b6 domain-containing protein [Solirubrobacteraceae bacterium]